MSRIKKYISLSGIAPIIGEYLNVMPISKLDEETKRALASYYIGPPSKKEESVNAICNEICREMDKFLYTPSTRSNIEELAILINERLDFWKSNKVLANDIKIDPADIMAISGAENQMAHYFSDAEEKRQATKIKYEMVEKLAETYGDDTTLGKLLDILKK